MAVDIMKIDRVLQEFSPLHYQCEWDNTGWNIRGSGTVTGIYVCLDVTETAVKEASKYGCEVILSHHPLIFKAIRSIDSGSYAGKMISDILRSDMSLFCAHTAVDSAPWGINGYTADRLGLKDTSFLEFTYEEEAGLGYIGDITEQPAGEFIKKIKSVLVTDSVRVSGDTGKIVQKAAVCSGGAGDLSQRARDMGADIYITGELKHNQYIENSNMIVVEAGHYDTEKCFLEVAGQYLQKRLYELQYDVTVFCGSGTERPYVNF